MVYHGLFIPLVHHLTPPTLTPSTDILRLSSHVAGPVHSDSSCDGPQPSQFASRPRILVLSKDVLRRQEDLLRDDDCVDNCVLLSSTLDSVSEAIEVMDVRAGSAEGRERSVR
eukprot:GHVN01059026.1.p1 GENE.GHVN01059026.1~~GHVN01059026.1.p1  ORF type:complete len:113 (+),score=23.09 GHVN01059026.1:123-461(+)